MWVYYVLTTLFVVQGCSAHTGYQIVDGSESPPHQLPSIVSIMSGIPATGSYKHMCGGTILSEKWVLTAAHCVTKAPSDEELGIYAGKHIIDQRENGQQFSGIKLKVVHQQYNEDSGENDIALLRLVTPLQFGPYIKAINLPKLNKIHTGMTVLYGWGSISKTETPEYPSVLQTVTIPIVENDKCYAVLHELPSDFRLFDTQLCTGPLRSSISACSGDGGTPLVKYDKNAVAELVGIVSWGVVPCGSGDPTIYTRVSAYIDWINHNIKNE